MEKNNIRKERDARSVEREVRLRHGQDEPEKGAGAMQ